MMKVILFGATGMVGAGAPRFMFESRDINRIGA